MPFPIAAVSAILVQAAPAALKLLLQADDSSQKLGRKKQEFAEFTQIGPAVAGAQSALTTLKDGYGKVQPDLEKMSAAVAKVAKNSPARAYVEALRESGGNVEKVATVIVGGKKDIGALRKNLDTVLRVDGGEPGVVTELAGLSGQLDQLADKLIASGVQVKQKAEQFAAAAKR